MTRVLLDFPGAAAPAEPAEPAAPAATSRLAFSEPALILQAATVGEVRRTIREAAAAAAGRWAVGFVAYEAAPAFDAALTTRPPAPDLPLAWFAIFDAPDLISGPDCLPAESVEPGPVAALEWSTPTPRARYDDAVARVREAIAAGDVYQVNHTLRFRTPFAVEPRQVYDRLVASRHGLYHALIETDGWAVISASPELFLEIRDGTVTTRPMKGTIRRGRWLEEDRAARARLAGSAKDRAENLMIVDLLRNDLGRVAEFGSVKVTGAFDIETYPTVHQMTSTVTARLRTGLALDDVFAATFPCGSITGAPKVTAMRAIAALEDEPRGAYCGALGLLRPDGSATFSVAIRTISANLRTRSAVYGSGGGITWDSVADAEYDELVAKAALLSETIPPFLLLETMRLDEGVVARRDLHMKRLRDSAEYWQFSDRTSQNADAALADLVRDHQAGSWRVRLTASRDGHVDIACAPLDANEASLDDAATARIAAFAAVPVSSRDRLLYHKTTARAVYEQRRASRPDAYDVLLCNEHGQVTEFTIGNVIIESGDALLTPPRECGLLAGCMRAELLAAGRIRERVLTPADVHAASRVWLVNSVRGWVRVQLEAEPAASRQAGRPQAR